MALESATYINQLIDSNPNGTDIKGQGDDHLRMIKKVLKSTFPNLTGAVLATQAQLNLLTDATQLLRPNMVMLWAGSVATIPSGWALCNGAGTTSTGLAIPNLQDRFIVGAGSGYGVGAAGGNISHNHAITVYYHVLTIGEMPSHTHNTGQLGNNINFDVNYIAQGGSPDGRFTGVNVQYTGGNAGHNHGGSSNVIDHRPPFYALAYIIKV